MATDRQQHSWKHLTVLLDGNTLTTLQDFTYNSSQSLITWYGSDGKPQIFIPGEESFTFNIILSEREYTALINASRRISISSGSPGEIIANNLESLKGSLLKLTNLTIVGVFLGGNTVGNLPVNFLGAGRNDITVNDYSRLHRVIATGCRFTSAGTSVLQGDKSILYNLPGVCLSVDE